MPGKDAVRMEMWITNGSIADVALVWAMTEEGVKGFLVEKDTPGFVVAHKEKKLGIRADDTAAYVFENCRIPKRYRLGEENMGFVYIMQNFQGERLVASVAAVAAIRPASLDVFFTSEAQAAVAAIACLYADSRFVDEFH